MVSSRKAFSRLTLGREVRSISGSAATLPGVQVQSPPDVPIGKHYVVATLLLIKKVDQSSQATSRDVDAA